MKHTRYRIIHLSRCKGVTRSILRKFLQKFPTLEPLYQFSPESISQTFSIPPQKASLIYRDLHNRQLIERIKKEIVTFPIITIVDESYPPMLNTIKDAPLVLYACGDLSLLSEQPKISVIGTRNPSKDAWAKTEFVVKPLVQEGWVIVSGLAKGIDSFAHEIALQHHGKTIAVLGSGFNHIYPRKNRKLFFEIANRGLVLSEYAPNIPPAKYHFPERNRIISGLSFGTLVIEAMEKSGTLITVEHALDQGREVFAVPDSPAVPQSKGCHQMIQDGAKLIQHAKDIVIEWQMIKHHYK